VTATPRPPAATRPGLLGRRDVRLLLAGQAVSELGSQVGSIALPLVAVLSLRATPLEIGLVTAAGTVAFAVAALPAGVWVDRVPRRPVLVGADLARGALLLTIPLAAALDRLTLVQLAVVAAAVGLARVLFDVAYPSYLPTLVDRDRLVQANAFLESNRSVTQLAGPGLGGWLVQLAGAPAAVAADAASFLGSACCLRAIRAPEPPRPGPGAGGCGGSWPTASGSCSASPPCGRSPPARPPPTCCGRPPGSCSCCSWSTRSG
jgi:MFS family permease